MKKIFIIMIGLLFTASAVFASPNANGEFATISKADTQMLFGSSSFSAVALSSAEMEVTEGKWHPFLIPFAIAGGYASGIGYLAFAQGNATSSGFGYAFLGGMFTSSGWALLTAATGGSLSGHHTNCWEDDVYMCD